MRAKRHINLEWDRFQVSMENTHEVPKLALVMLISSTILELLGIMSCPYMASYMMASYGHAHVRF